MSDSMPRRVRRMFTLNRPWFATVGRDTMRDDAMAGLTNAAIVLPQGVAFAVIAGLPPQYGLFTAMITPIIAAIWGSSVVMVSGPTTAISAVLFATLTEITPAGTPAYVELALGMTIIVGLMQLAAGIAQIGALISFISHSVIIGFTAAAALLIAVSQLADVLGLTVDPGGSVFARLYRVYAGLDQTNLTALAISGSTLATVIVIPKINKRLPAYIVALLVGSVTGYALGAPDHGIQMFSSLPSIVPSLTVPGLDFSTTMQLVPGAATIAFVGLLEAISIGRSFALRRGDAYDANQEIVGQGLSNAIGGFFQAYAGSGSFTRSALNAESGARTPLAAIFAAAFLLIMLFLLSPFVQYIPVPAMGGIILYIAWRLINAEEIRHIITSSRSETAILLATFLTGIATQLDFAIIVGVICSLFFFLRKSSLPWVGVMSPATYRGVRSFRNARLYNLKQCPQIAAIRIEGPLFFASIEHVEHEFRNAEAEAGERPIVALTLRSVGDIDLSGADFLVKEIETCRKRGGDLHLVATYLPLLRTLARTHVLEILGKQNLHASKYSAVAAAVEQADEEICRNCHIRSYFECKGKPKPTDLVEREDTTEIVEILGPQRNSGQG
ncbi:SulP family inorganic anion transporter [Ruegeria hyattellae]|uniref:SulP family inorganic anion transporter n=1 Tax=Ruegeria hyattellae TaxID=3233337 RepID=UPI00355B8A35